MNSLEYNNLQQLSSSSLASLSSLLSETTSTSTSTSINDFDLQYQEINYESIIIKNDLFGYR